MLPPAPAMRAGAHAMSTHAVLEPARAMRLALADAGRAPEEVEYVNLHGTSTQLNDRIETQAIKNVFGEHARKLVVTSTKGAIGHMLGAAGAVWKAKRLTDGCWVAIKLLRTALAQDPRATDRLRREA